VFFAYKYIDFGIKKRGKTIDLPKKSNYIKSIVNQNKLTGKTKNKVHFQGENK